MTNVKNLSCSFIFFLYFYYLISDLVQGEHDSLQWPRKYSHHLLQKLLYSSLRVQLTF